MKDVLNAAKEAEGDKDTLANKSAVAEYFLENVPVEEQVGNQPSLDGVNSDPATVENAINDINALLSKEVVTLTNGTDIETADIFNAPMVYTPDGSDRILTLQDEDVLTGAGDNATLNAVLGNSNDNEGTTTVVTPTLKNIENINIDWTGNTRTLDLRYADDTLSEININKVTSDAGSVSVNNISSPASNLTVAHTADPSTNVTFNYTRGVLSEDNSLNLTLDNVLAGNITQNSTAGTSEGFEELTIDAKNNVYLTSIDVNELEKVKITGTNNLEIVSLNSESEYSSVENGGFVANNSAGIREIDASEFEGNLALDITSAMGRNVDPNNSGAPFYGAVKGGKGDDTFYTRDSIAGDNLNDNNQHNIIDGGEGENTIVSTVGGIANDADITNIQTLELRDQTFIPAPTAIDPAFGTIDIDAFDENLTKVFMRDEDSNPTTFALTDVTKELAEDGLTLAHATSDTAGQGATGDTVVDVSLKDATGSDDTVALTIVNDKNEGDQFNYTLTAVGVDTDNNGPLTGSDANSRDTAKYDKDAVENITIHDNDTETNSVILTNVYDHTGTITLDGGSVGNNFTIAQTLNAKTIDASGQVSNLRLTVGDTTGVISPIDQDVKLGKGDDVLTFANIDEFGGGDTLSDEGGNDTVRALFSEDSSLNLTGIENLHLASNANVKLDMANADVTNLVLLSDTAIGGSDLDNNGVAEAPGQVPQISNIITLTNTKLTELNFFGDADKYDENNIDADRDNLDDNINDIGNEDIDRDNLDDNNTNTSGNDESTTHRFNGVTLDNNSAEDLTVNINTSLDYSSNDTVKYDIGTITSHGNKTMDIVVGNEQPIADGAISSETVTEIHNIYGKNLETITARADGNLNLGTISGDNAVGSLKLIDMTDVKGQVEADVISLGDNGVVKLGDGNHDFSALSSSGKDITITSGNGKSTIVGSAQSDTITAGSGNDKLHGDRGDNKIFAGEGNDFVTAKDGNDTIDFGTGFGVYVDNLGTGLTATNATNAVSLSSGIVSTLIDVNGDTKITSSDAKADDKILTYNDIYDGASVNFANVSKIDGAGDDVNQALAVGKGSDLTISWTGDDINVDRATLDGGVATEVTTAGTISGDDNANLYIQTGNGAVNFNGAGGNDVYIVTVDDADNGLTFSGEDGNDAVVAGMGSDDITGGDGADMIVLQNKVSFEVNNPDGVFDNKTDTIHIADGESIAGEHDVISGFQASASNQDDLDLATTTIAATNTTYNIAYGTITNATVGANGLITFNSGETIDDTNLGDVLGFLAQNIGNNTNSGAQVGETVIFRYDVDGNGTIDEKDASFIFQDGVNDTLVELLHNPADTGATFTGISTSATDNMVHII
jgi:hypothetical protein